MGAYKPFDRDLYNAADAKAKAAVMNHLHQQGRFTQSVEKQGVDIVSLTPAGDIYIREYHEVEIKYVWKSAWPTMWNTVQLPERKGRYRKMYPNDPFFFWICNADATMAWKFPLSAVKDDYLTEVSNVKIRSGEMFFKVPVSEAELILL